MTAEVMGLSPVGPPNPLWRVRQARSKPPESQSGNRRFKSGTRRQHFLEPWASWSGRLIVNQERAGSSPVGSAIRLRSLAAQSGGLLIHQA